ncbi:LuxR C-terminal-related transcriptional regulator [Lysobacter sp. FW306-1B-D06B]|uniref:helix-turn-helix transcriptional regulator n=1 Tax=Lysobacter sp. FW306-1B-D06B TaxID=3140250 RepID=UPI0031404C8A
MQRKRGAGLRCDRVYGGVPPKGWAHRSSGWWGPRAARRSVPFPGASLRSSEVRAERKMMWTSNCTNLTWRERQVLDGLVRGLAMKQIAYELNLPRQTAGKYRSELARKLSVRTDISIYFAAVERGLIKPKQPAPQRLGPDKQQNINNSRRSP